MKQFAWAIVILIGLGSCSNNNSSTDVKLDSIGKKLDSSANRIWDSTKEKAREIKGRIENKLNKRDSAQKADTTNKK